MLFGNIYNFYTFSIKDGAYDKRNSKTQDKGLSL